jgi:AAA15 family ATPase/GTPase
MNIVALKIKNFLSITDVEIMPGKINQIVGSNNQGKTSIIKAIEFAIKGSADGSLVRFGEDAAEVVVELSDSTNIKRRINSEGKQTVKVSKDGFAAQSPQSLLDGLFESSSFNPLDLLDPKKRADAILNSIDIKVDEAVLTEELKESEFVKILMPPLDYSQHGLKVIDQAYKYFYQRRAEANKDAADKKKRYETYVADLPKENPLNETREQIQAELDAAKAKKDEAEKKLESVIQTHVKNREAQARADKYIQAVTDIEKQLAALEARKLEGQKFVDSALSEVSDALEDDMPYRTACSEIAVHMEQIKAKFSQVDRFESVQKQKGMVDDMKAQWDRAQSVADGLTKKVDALGGPVKKKLMASAEMPVDGLEYKDGAFLVDGVPVDNLSSSKAIKLAIGVARKLAKKTKVICLDGAEMLDEETWRSFHSEIKDDGFVYFLTKVGDPFKSEGDKIISMENGNITKQEVLQ